MLVHIRILSEELCRHGIHDKASKKQRLYFMGGHQLGLIASNLMTVTDDLEKRILDMQLTQLPTTSCDGTILERGFGAVTTTCCANL